MVAVVVRLPTTGTLFGPRIRAHAGSKLTSVPNWRPSRNRVDLLALVEGLPHPALAEVLMMWQVHYGLPAHVLGDPPNALILQVPLERAPSPIDNLLRMDADLRVLGNIMEGDAVEQWIECDSRDAAEALVAKVRGAVGGATVDIAEPRPKDREAWEMLRATQALLGMT